MMPPIIRQATREDIAAFAPDKLAPTIRALCMELDGEIIGIAGIAFLSGRWRAFCDLKDAARPYKYRIARSAVKFFAELRADGIRYIFAERDENEPRSLQWLESLGFKPDVRSGHLHRWDA